MGSREGSMKRQAAFSAAMALVCGVIVVYLGSRCVQAIELGQESARLKVEELERAWQQTQDDLEKKHGEEIATLDRHVKAAQREFELTAQEIDKQDGDKRRLQGEALRARDEVTDRQISAKIERQNFSDRRRQAEEKTGATFTDDGRLIGIKGGPIDSLCNFFDLEQGPFGLCKEARAMESLLVRLHDKAIALDKEVEAAKVVVDGVEAKAAAADAQLKQLYENRNERARRLREARDGIEAADRRLRDDLERARAEHEPSIKAAQLEVEAALPVVFREGWTLMTFLHELVVILLGILAALALVLRTIHLFNSGASLRVVEPRAVSTREDA